MRNFSFHCSPRTTRHDRQSQNNRKQHQKSFWLHKHPVVFSERDRGLLMWGVLLAPVWGQGAGPGALALGSKQRSPSSV